MAEIKIFYNNGEIVSITDYVSAYPDGSWFTINRSGNKTEHYSAYAIECIIEIAGDD